MTALHDRGGLDFADPSLDLTQYTGYECRDGKLHLLPDGPSFGLMNSEEDNTTYLFYNSTVAIDGQPDKYDFSATFKMIKINRAAIEADSSGKQPAFCDLSGYESIPFYCEENLSKGLYNPTPFINLALTDGAVTEKVEQATAEAVSGPEIKFEFIESEDNNGLVAHAELYNPGITVLHIRAESEHLFCEQDIEIQAISWEEYPIFRFNELDEKGAPKLKVHTNEAFTAYDLLSNNSEIDVETIMSRFNIRDFQQLFDADILEAKGEYNKDYETGAIIVKDPGNYEMVISCLQERIPIVIWATLEVVP